MQNDFDFYESNLFLKLNEKIKWILIQYLIFVMDSENMQYARSQYLNMRERPIDRLKHKGRQIGTFWRVSLRMKFNSMQPKINANICSVER